MVVRVKALPPMQESERSCEACGSPASKWCAKCLGSLYCSAGCQRAAYEAHNELCVWRRTRDMTIRSAIGLSNAPQCVSYFRFESTDPHADIIRGYFEFKRGTCTSLTPSQFDRITAGIVALHTRNTENGERSAVLGVPAVGRPKCTSWHRIDVADVYSDPPRWVSQTIKHVLDERRLACPPPETSNLKLSPEDRVVVVSFIPRLINALKAHCCEEGEDDVRL